MADLNSFIRDFDPASLEDRQGELVIEFNKKNKRTNLNYLAAGAQKSNSDWDNVTTYALDNIVTDNNKAWKSLQAGNLNNKPAENSFWTEVTISPADGIFQNQWAAGVFLYNSAVVVFDEVTYYLNVPAPYESTDFATELAAEDWIKAPTAPQNWVDFTPQSPEPTYTEGRVFYDDVKKNYVFMNDRTQVRMDLGRELWTRCINKTGTASTNGLVVYISGASGGLPEVMLAQANDLNTSRVIAVYTENVAIDGNGEGTSFGEVKDIDTSAWAPGTLLYLSESTPGGLTDQIPLPPNAVLPIGYVITQHATEGSLFVRVGDIEPPINSSVSASWSAFSGSTSATNWVLGYYTFQGTAFTPSGTPQTLGSANVAYGAHAYIVLGAASTNMVVRFSGTSFSDDTGRTAGDTEDIDTSGGAIDDFFETSKKWIGQVSITLLSGAGVIVDYGWNTYWNNRNTRFVVSSLEWTGRSGANDTAPNISLYHHKLTGWTYTGTGAIPPPPIADMQSLYVTEYQISNGQYFKFKITGISEVIFGDQSEGIIIGVDISANNAIANSNIEVQKIG